MLFAYVFPDSNEPAEEKARRARMGALAQALAIALVAIVVVVWRISMLFV